MEEIKNCPLCDMNDKWVLVETEDHIEYQDYNAQIECENCNTVMNAIVVMEGCDMIEVRKLTEVEDWGQEW